MRLFQKKNAKLIFMYSKKKTTIKSVNQKRNLRKKLFFSKRNEEKKKLLIINMHAALLWPIVRTNDRLIHKRAKRFVLYCCCVFMCSLSQPFGLHFLQYSLLEGVSQQCMSSSLVNTHSFMCIDIVCSHA